jgi:hypothetical protein
MLHIYMITSSCYIHAAGGRTLMRWSPGQGNTYPTGPSIAKGCSTNNIYQCNPPADGAAPWGTLFVQRSVPVLKGLWDCILGSWVYGVPSCVRLYTRRNKRPHMALVILGIMCTIRLSFLFSFNLKLLRTSNKSTGRLKLWGGVSKLCETCKCLVETRYL